MKSNPSETTTAYFSVHVTCPTVYRSQIVSKAVCPTWCTYLYQEWEKNWPPQENSSRSPLLNAIVSRDYMVLKLKGWFYIYILHFICYSFFFRRLFLVVVYFFKKCLIYTLFRCDSISRLGVRERGPFFVCYHC